MSKKELVFDIETLGLDPLRSRIIAIGFKSSKKYFIKISEDEKELLRWFWNFSKENFLIGWNILRFDIPFIKMRSLIHNINMTRLRVLDLFRELFLDNQKWHSLSDVSEALFGKPKPSTSQIITEAYLTKNFKTIEKYLKKDLELTSKIFERMKKTYFLKDIKYTYV